MPKIVRYSMYYHRKYLPKRPKVQKMLAQVPQGFPWVYARVPRLDNPKGFTFGVSFVCCPGFDIVDEPICGPSIRVSEKSISYRAAPRDPHVLHAKHLLVTPAYKGFSWEAARDRYKRYFDAPWLDKLRMGWLSWWRANGLARLDGLASDWDAAMELPTAHLQTDWRLQRQMLRLLGYDPVLEEDTDQPTGRRRCRICGHTEIGDQPRMIHNPDCPLQNLLHSTANRGDTTPERH
jgi:hypothetical protein